MGAKNPDSNGGGSGPQLVRKLGCLQNLAVPLAAIFVIAIILVLWNYSTHRGVDRTVPRGAWQTQSGVATSAGAGSGNGTGSGAQQTGGDATAGHDESKPHVGQQWMPTYVKAGTWSVALAREEPLTESLEKGKNTLLVDVYVVNDGAADSAIDAKCFSLRGGSAKKYPMSGVERQDAPQGSPVYVEAAFEVPIDTQGLALRFTPPEGTGGTIVDVPLPNIAYSKPQ